MANTLLSSVSTFLGPCGYPYRSLGVQAKVMFFNVTGKRESGDRVVKCRLRICPSPWCAINCQEMVFLIYMSALIGNQ